MKTKFGENLTILPQRNALNRVNVRSDPDGVTVCFIKIKSGFGEIGRQVETPDTSYELPPATEREMRKAASRYFENPHEFQGEISPQERERVGRGFERLLTRLRGAA